MTLSNFQFFSDRLAIYLTTGNTLWIYFNENSGKVYYRYKIGFPTWAKHTGVFVGTDNLGREWWIHNHIDFGRAHLVTGDGFRVGMPIYVHDEYCSNDWRRVIEKGLQHVLNGERYMPASFNCQVMTNDSCHNERKSEDADKVMGAVLLGLGLLAVCALAAGSSSTNSRA